MSNSEHLHPATSKISRSTNGGSSYTDLTDCMEISPAELSKTKSKDTSLDNTSRTHTYTFNSWVEPGDAEVTLYFHKTQFNTILAAFITPAVGGAALFWKITAPVLSSESTPSILVFQGDVTKLKIDKISIDSDDHITRPVTIGASGVPTFTAGS